MLFVPPLSVCFEGTPPLLRCLRRPLMNYPSQLDTESWGEPQETPIVARLVPVCRSSARSWLRDLRDASYAGWSRSWRQSRSLQAAISKTKDAKLRADGVCLAARHAPTLMARLQTLGCRCPSGAAAASRVRVLGSVTFVMLHTPDGVARGLRAADCKP